MRIVGYAFLLFACAFAALGQSTTFSNPNVEFTFQIPEPKWKVVKSASAGRVEMVYGDRSDGYLEIRKSTVAATTPMADIIRDQEDKVQFKPSYVAGKQEHFIGKLTGTVFNFEYVESGRAMTGRYYILRSGDTVYVLRFSGYQDSLRSIRPLTDSIARTFEIKKS